MDEIYENMQQLTGKESGMLLFGSREYIIGNWTQVNGIPHVFYGELLGLGEVFAATSCEVPPEMVEAMQAHEADQGTEPSKDGFHAWEIFIDGGFICTVAVQDCWA